ncbi:MAG: diguanylate cyclase [Actinomycetota bacterium]|nr:diguanylate cyclase [Actinomycetota bacterium]
MAQLAGTGGDGLGTPTEIAPRVWWVGASRPGETFQCHAYLVEAGEHSVLIDPGSSEVIDDVLAKVRQIIPTELIKWVVCHHSDPDIAAGLPRLRQALPRADVELVTEWRAQTLLHHYHAGFPYYLVEENAWQLPLDGDRQLRFALTPYLHFPGALCSWDRSTGVLFSSDLFGGFTDGSDLFARDGSYFEAMRPFHEHYMPSREILAAGLSRLQRAFRPITAIAPQHGCVIPQPLVDEMFDRLKELECGIFLIAREDLDVARLLRVSNAVRRMTDALVMAHDLPELAAIAQRVLPDMLPVGDIELYVETADEGLLRFAAADGYVGSPGAMPTASATSLVLPVGGGGPAASVHIELTEPADISHEMAEMFLRLVPALRVALHRHLEQRQLEHEHEELQESAMRDALTGLLNRHALERMARRDLRFGVLMIDIDHFKQVNDTYGHVAGDRVLQEVARCCRDAVRAADLVFRYGGEEMVVLLPNADRAHTISAAERVREAVSRLVVPDVAGLAGVTISVGASMHHRGQPVAEAIDDADRSLYVAKAAGRNRVQGAW